MFLKCKFWFINFSGATTHGMPVVKGQRKTRLTCSSLLTERLYGLYKRGWEMIGDPPLLFILLCFFENRRTNLRSLSLISARNHKETLISTWLYLTHYCLCYNQCWWFCCFFMKEKMINTVQIKPSNINHLQPLLRQK